MGNEFIKNEMERNEKYSSNSFNELKCRNLLVGESVEEINLRLRFLLVATTPIHTFAMEGGKRQMVALWNDLNMNVQQHPVKSFFNLPMNARLIHRPSPKTKRRTAFSNEMDECNDLFYSRSKVGIPSHMYCGNSKCQGFTKQMVKVASQESGAIASEITIEGRLCNFYIAMVAEQCGHKEHILNSTIVANPFDTTDTFFEKYPFTHTMNVARFFMEEFALLAKDTTHSRTVSTLYSEWGNLCRNHYQQFCDYENKEYEQFRNGKEFKGDADSNLILMKNFVTANLKTRNNNKYYKNNKFDPCLTEKTLQPPTNKPNPDDLKKVFDPTTLEFFYSFFVATQNHFSKIQDQPRVIGTWNPMEYVLLFMTFATSVYDKDTCRTFQEVVERNGQKTTQGYIGYYAHEIKNEKLDQDYVSRNIFDSKPTENI